MRGRMSLPVLDDVSGEVMGVIEAQEGLLTSLGVFLGMSDEGALTFVDAGGVVSRHPQARPFVMEDEARKWSFVQAQAQSLAMAV